MKYLGYIQFIVLVLFIWLGWQIIDRITFREEMITPLGAALQSAKNNRKELEKVLRHYQKNPADSLKYKAACFLIENMPFYSYSTSKQLENYKSYYAWLKKSRGQTAKQVADSVKKVYGPLGEPEKKHDIREVDSAYLCNNIEWAFKVWREQPWGKNVSFETFCDYILPYRQENGLLVDSARQVFYSRHQGQFFTNPGKNMIEEADSLLRLYSYIGHSGFHATGIPIWDVATLEKLRHGLCTHKCWHNTLLFSSLGIAVATDIVPAWANRGSSHSWSVLIEEGDIHPFNPFWEQGLWQYKRLYNNMDYHKYWGRFRLPKVFRKTYRYYMEGPLADGVPAKDIPEAFRSLRKKDVSHEYFDTVNVRIKLRKMPSGTKYAYLCVWNYNNWKPVHWGKITGDMALFSGMGKDIAYLPMYCMDGEMVVAADPVLVQKDGKVRILHPEDTREEMVTTQYLSLIHI